MKLVTMITESVLVDRLTHELRRLGATGWTLTEARGDGSRGMRSVPMPGENVRIECVVSPEVADLVMEMLARDFFPNYAMVAWLSDVEVVRGEKYRR
jgi:nitrogen regulatory protein P-II 2